MRHPHAWLSTTRLRHVFRATACLLLTASTAHAIVEPDEPFDPALIPIEMQAWWVPNFGHIHAATRVPLGQEVSGVLEFDVRVVLHNNPSHFIELRVDDDNGILRRIFVDLECPYDGTVDTNCAFNVPVTLDTTEMTDGWRELRIRATTDTPDGQRYLNSSGIPIDVQNGGPDTDYDRYCDNRSLIGRGWYEEFGYTNAIIECIPLEPVTGMHTFRVRAQEPSSHLNVALDRTHFIPAVGAWPEQPATPGSTLFDADGDFQSWVSIPVDTTTLANGWHSLAVTSTGTDGSTSECSYCNGEFNTTVGTAKTWFFVDNPPPPCAVDLDADGVVGFSDILVTISSWGPCAPGSCPADVNGDGTVGFADLLLVVAGWGPCSE